LFPEVDFAFVAAIFVITSGPMSVSEQPLDASLRRPRERPKHAWTVFGFQIERTAKVGDLLTSFSLVISVAAIIFAWHQDIASRKRQQADAIRTAAAVTLAKLIRWGELSSSIFDELQPVILEASQALPKSGVDAARDAFWVGYTKAHITTEKKKIDDQIEGAFTALYGYNPDMKKKLTATLKALQDGEERMLSSFLHDCEVQIRSFLDKGKMEVYTTASLGNPLRDIVDRYRENYAQDIKASLQGTDEFLSSLVRKTDTDLLAGAKPEPVAPSAATN
jgi:hypothetical protein